MESSLDTLQEKFRQADADLKHVLTVLEGRYETASSSGPHNEDDGTDSDDNPVRLLARVRELRAQIPALQTESSEVIAAKQDLLRVCSRVLVANRASVQKLQSRAGIEVEANDQDLVYTGFLESVDKWQTQTADYFQIEGHEVPADLAEDITFTQHLQSELSGDVLNAADEHVPVEGGGGGNDDDEGEDTDEASSSSSSSTTHTARGAASRRTSAPRRDGQGQGALGRKGGASSKKAVSFQHAAPPSPDSGTGTGTDTDDVSSTSTSIFNQPSARCSTVFVPITPGEFAIVSSLVRGRSKLKDVNDVYKLLFDHFNRIPESRHKPLTTAMLVKIGCKVTGATGECKLNTLRSMKIIDIKKAGVMMVV